MSGQTGMQKTKRDVELSIESVSGEQTVRQRVRGTMFRKDNRWFYRYQEPDEAMGRTISIVQAERDAIRVLRQGDVQAEQTFIAGRSTAGFYATPHGRLPLQTKTRKLSVRLTDEGFGSLAWTYELFAGGEPAGRFAITIGIRPFTAAETAQER